MAKIPWKKSYKIDKCQLYLGDCEKILPVITDYDMLLTDPPYGMNFRSNYRSKKYSYIKGDNNLPLSKIYLAIHKAMHSAYVFCRWDNLHEMPKPKSFLVWIKNNWSMGDLKHEHGRQWEGCCFYPKQNHKFVKRIPDVIACKRTGNILHPTQKPIELMETIIKANEVETVCDPFMGSGTTGVACVKLGKTFTGIEIDEEYFDIACNRIRDAFVETLI